MTVRTIGQEVECSASSFYWLPLGKARVAIHSLSSRLLERLPRRRLSASCGSRTSRASAIGQCSLLRHKHRFLWKFGTSCDRRMLRCSPQQMPCQRCRKHSRRAFPLKPTSHECETHWTRRRNGTTDRLPVEGNDGDGAFARPYRRIAGSRDGGCRANARRGVTASCCGASGTRGSLRCGKIRRGGKV